MSDDPRDIDEAPDGEASSDEQQRREDAAEGRVERDVDFVGTGDRRTSDDQPAEVVPLGGERGSGGAQMPSSSGSAWDGWQHRQPPAPSGPIEELEMSAPNFFTRGIIVTGFGLLAGAIFYGGQLWSWFTAPEAPVWLKALIVIVPAAYLLYVAYRAMIYPGERRLVRFEDDGVVLPKSSNSKLDDRASYEEIQAVLAVARGPVQSVIVDYGRATVMYSSRDFAREDAPALLRRELLRRIGELPNSDEVLERLEQQEQRSRDLSQRSNKATMFMLGVIALAFVFQHYQGALDTTLGMVRWGGGTPPLIDEGQYFRLVSANLFHGGWLHLLLNGVALFFLGTVIEKITDKWTLVWVTLFSGLLGMGTSWLLTDPWPFSVGSSAAIFGLFGGFAVIHLKYGKDLPALYRQSTRWWVIIIVLNGGLSFGIDMVDEWAHMGGMIAGALAMWIALLTRSDFDSVDRPPTWVKAAAGVMVAIFVGGVAWTGSYAAKPHPEDIDTMYEALVERAQTGQIKPMQVNQVVWTKATAEDVTEGRLRILEEAGEAIVSAENDRPEYVDTLATVRYRLGRLVEDPEEKQMLYRSAIEDELGILGESTLPTPGALEEDSGETFATQLARFLDAHRKDFGAWDRAGVDSSPTMEFVPKGDGTLEVEWEREGEGTVRMFAVAKSDGELEGLVQLCLPADESTLSIEDDQMATWPNNLRLYPAYYDGEDDECEDTIAYWPAVESIAAYP